MLASASAFNVYVGIAVNVVCFFMALLSFRGISTPSLKAQGEQRRSCLFNIPRDNPRHGIVEAHFAPGERGGYLPFQIADRLAAFGRSLGDARDALGGLDVSYRNHFALRRFPRSGDLHKSAAL
jgi:hypothetical protein